MSTENYLIRNWIYSALKYMPVLTEEQLITSMNRMVQLIEDEKLLDEKLKASRENKQNSK